MSECPKWVIALLRDIDRKMGIVYWNNRNKYQRQHMIEYESPFENSGARYKNDTFEVEAYSWNDEEEQEWNFKCGEIEIRWYKYLGRGTTINGKYNEREIIEMYEKCLKSLNKEDRDEL